MGQSVTSYGASVGVRVSDPSALPALLDRLPPGWQAAKRRTVERLYSLVVGKENDATRMLVELISQNPAGVLIVMGTHGRTGLSRLIWGSRAEEVVRTAPCSVLVVKEPAGG